MDGKIKPYKSREIREQETYCDKTCFETREICHVSGIINGEVKEVHLLDETRLCMFP
jgi:hypothetical protein